MRLLSTALLSIGLLVGQVVAQGNTVYTTTLPWASGDTVVISQSTDAAGDTVAITTLSTISATTTAAAAATTTTSTTSRTSSIATATSTSTTAAGVVVVTATTTADDGETTSSSTRTSTRRTTTATTTTAYQGPVNQLTTTASGESSTSWYWYTTDGVVYSTYFTPSYTTALSATPAPSGSIQGISDYMSSVNAAVATANSAATSDGQKRFGGGALAAIVGAALTFVGVAAGAVVML